MARSTLFLLLATIALASCGADDATESAEETDATGTATTTVETAPAGDRASEEDGGGPEGGRAGDAPPEDGSSPAADDPAKGDDAGGPCEYHPPPGRLGSSTISIGLSGTPCEVGRRLAKAAALGQPAGANIPVSSKGYRCEPSTTERGVNAVYTCSKGSRGASFEIEWTAG